MAYEHRTNDGQRLEKLIEQNKKLIEQNEKLIKQNELIFEILCVLSKTNIRLGKIMNNGFYFINKKLYKEGE